MNGEETALLAAFRKSSLGPNETALHWLEGGTAEHLKKKRIGLLVVAAPQAGVLVLTDQRVVFFASGLTGTVCESTPLVEITGMYCTKVPAGTEISVHAMGKPPLVFTTGEGEIFVEEWMAQATGVSGWASSPGGGIRADVATEPMAEVVSTMVDPVDEPAVVAELTASRQAERKKRSRVYLAIGGLLIFGWLVSRYVDSRQEQRDHVENIRRAAKARVEAAERAEVQKAEAAAGEVKRRLAAEKRQAAAILRSDAIADALMNWKAKDTAPIGSWTKKHRTGVDCTYTLRKERGVFIMKVACSDSSEPGADARLKVRKTDKGLKMQSVGGDPGEYYLLTKLATLEAYDEMGRIFRLWSQ
jgi:hypothetical protein